MTFTHGQQQYPSRRHDQQSNGQYNHPSHSQPSYRQDQQSNGQYDHPSHAQPPYSQSSQHPSQPLHTYEPHPTSPTNSNYSYNPPSVYQHSQSNHYQSSQSGSHPSSRSKGYQPSHLSHHPSSNISLASSTNLHYPVQARNQSNIYSSASTIQPSINSSNQHGYSVMGNRKKTIRNIPLTPQGNLVIDIPVSDKLLQLGGHSFDHEFTHSRYTAVTCHPDEFATSGYSLRQQELNRTTEIFVVVTM